ncbi:MAG: type II secretion system protein [Bdellovibrionales bacterium]|nr:type II secretion system protein [Bdellovibrionales bacterium]
MKFPFSNKGVVNFSSVRGVTLIEIIITTLLFVTVTAAAYKIWVTATRKATETQQETMENRKLQEFFNRFRHQIENTIQLPNSLSTMMRVEIPSGTDGCDSEGYSIMGWGFIPYPGHDVALMNTNQDDFQIVDPSSYVALVTPESSDAVRLVFLETETQMYKLKIDPSTSPPVPYETAFTNIIVIESATPVGLKKGDYAVISDALRSDLLRITNIIQLPGTDTYHVTHDTSVSDWNLEFVNNHGGNVQGGAFLYKVGVATYALDTQTNTLMVDDHRLDDGFNGTDFSGGTPGLALNWQPVSSGIKNFQVIVETVNGETRTPMAGVPGKAYEDCTSTSPRTPQFCDCENQLGNPGILNIRAEVSYVDE